MSRLLARRTGNSGNDPGPGAYSIHGTIGDAPKYTIKGRHESTMRPFTAPYRSLPTTVGNGPKISMASRHADREITATPGPNYVPPALGADAKKTTMSYRHSEARDSRLDNPGPGAYDIQPRFANDAQKSTLHQRTGKNDSNTISPGPAAYLPNMDAVKKRAPSATMHVRPRDSQLEVTPGPSDYAISRNLGGPSSTLHTKPKDSQTYVTPGPGAYNPTDKTLGNAPKYTMKGRYETKQNVNAAPYRSLPTTVGNGPKISMSSRHADREITATPGPNYVPPALGADAPKPSLSYRHAGARDSRIDNPGPGAYNIEPKFANDAQKYTLHQRTGKTDDTTISPGPGASLPNIDAVRKRAPASSIHIRPKDNQPESTPGYVDLGSTLNGKGITIGLRENLDLVQV